MVTSCVVFGCNNLQDKRIKRRFHTFPFARPEVLKCWIAAIPVGRKIWEPSKTCRICSDHFLESDYEERPRWKLKAGAVPSVFNIPSNLQGKCVPRRVRSAVKHCTCCTCRPKIVKDEPELCHFEEQEFEKHPIDGKKKLLPTAVPSIFPTHTIKLPSRVSHDQSKLLADQECLEQLASLPVSDGNGSAESATKLVQSGSASLNSLPSRVSSDQSKLLADQECLEQLASLPVSDGNGSAESDTKLVQSSSASLNSDLHVSDESANTLLQRYQQEIVLLKQTLHSYKQRAWHMDVVLSALRKENELLRGTVQELSPNQLNKLLDLQDS